MTGTTSATFQRKKLIVKIQILREDGTVLIQQMGSAFSVVSWQAMENGELLDPPDKALFGFSYVPCYVAPDGLHSLEVVETVTKIEEINPERDIQI